VPLPAKEQQSLPDFLLSRTAGCVWKTPAFSIPNRKKLMAIRSGDCGGQKSVSKSRNESPGKMFHSISMEILAVWGVATSLQELYVLHSFIHAFQSQKVLKHVRIALGVYCYCFVFFILKM
jgi:hypothetical protein